ncbi:hypothetical protein DRB06_11440 [Actinomyces sp. Z5]|uniref:hypothetical protein n=1 Tax=Actinomyces sp. Z5 TaxID=2250216 RepID=UPI000DCD55C3|nr:hypothetical protein [Actinomyces sp. Z5]RAX19741.1 hypothetical protein DRB06_11440 [Actinomyces sp. Z5]
MTQPPNPGQPYIPPSAGSASGSYNPQQYPPQVQQPASYPQAQAAQPGQPAQAQYQQAAYQAGSYAQPAAPKADSFMTNLFDGARDFASKYGKTIFIVGFVANVVMWIASAINGGLFTFMSGIDELSTHFDVLAFFRVLFIGGGVQGASGYLGIAQFIFNILVLRLIIEIAAKVGAPKTDTPAA